MRNEAGDSISFIESNHSERQGGLIKGKEATQGGGSPYPRRIGVFGGTFDPIHVGHLIAAQTVLEEAELDIVLFVPNRDPPHKSDRTVTPARHRVAMVDAAIKSNPRFELDSTEADRPGPSYSVDTLRQIKSRYPDETEIMFILGRDALLQIESWHQPSALVTEFSFIAMDRPQDVDISYEPSAIFGIEFTDPPYDDGPSDESIWECTQHDFPELAHKVSWIHVPQIGVSSKLIRELRSRGHSLRYLVPAEVEAYIVRERLYESV